MSEHVTDEMQYIETHSGSGVIRWSVHIHRFYSVFYVLVDVCIYISSFYIIFLFVCLCVPIFLENYRADLSEILHGPSSQWGTAN